MAKNQTYKIGDLKPSMDLERPWTSRSRKKTPLPERANAVVYVVGRECADTCKIGVTSSLRARMSALGGGLHIFHWVEFDRGTAFQVETLTKALLRKTTKHYRGEWFRLDPEFVAEAIEVVVAALNVTPVAAAGCPGDMDYEMSEVEQVLSEPARLQPTNGRLDREFWSPQARSFSC